MDHSLSGSLGRIVIFIKKTANINSKTYQFINVVNGVSHSHKTANTFFSFDPVALELECILGLRDAITRQLIHLIIT